MTCLSGALTLLATNTMAADQASTAVVRDFAAANAPNNFRLSEASVQLTRSQSKFSKLPHSITLSLEGGRRIEAGESYVTEPLAPRDLLAAINTLYQSRFFELPDDMTVLFGVGMDGHGVVRQRALEMSDASWTKVCLRIGQRQKCVRFSSHGPLELLRWADTLFDSAVGKP